MRRLSLVLVTLTLAGCDALRDAFSARPEVVARANDQTLTVERLADMAGNGKQVPLDPLALGRLAHVWVDYALFAQAVAAGQDLRDSATVAAAMWPLVSQLKWEHFHDRLITPRADLSPAQVDSAYQAGEARMFQHILLQVPPSAAPTADTQKRRQAEQLLPQARRAGARFGPLAARYSEDPGSKVQGGALGVSERGQFVPAFEDAAWQLAPGGVSDIVKSPFGYHIIRRPPLAEVRDSFRAGIEQRLAYRLDSLYMDSLTTKRRIEPVGRAAARVRAAAQDLDEARSSGRVLVRYRGGSFRVRDLVRWLAALDPQVAQSLPRATDEQITQFLKVIAQRQLMLQQADSAGVTVTAEDWGLLRAQHDSALGILGGVLNLTPQMARDSAATPDARQRFAMARVQDYFDRVVRGRARFFPLPPFLGETLREKATWRVDQAGVRRALERGREIRASVDSLQAPGVPRMTPPPPPGPPRWTPRRAVESRSMRGLVALGLALAAIPRGGAAQQAPRPLDRIVAVVGTRAILASQIEEKLVQLEAQSGQVPPDSAGRAAVRRQILDQEIELELLVQQAQRDTSVKVTEQEVLDQVEQTYQNVRKQFSSETEFQDQLRAARFGSVEEWRRWLADAQRRDLLAQRLIETQQQHGKLRPIPPTEAQMREFWEARRAQQPKRPAAVSFRQIVIKPKPDSAAKARARRLADSLLVELRRGADFAAAAKRFSADSGSREQGGELGWFRRGVMVKEFEDVAFLLRPGQISDVIETAFGFHIIKVERAQPAEILARHVLIQAEISPAQVAIARRLADSVQAGFAGGASFDSLARRFADPEEPKLGEDAPLDRLPPEYQRLLASDTTRGLKPVVAVGAETPRPSFVVLDVTARHAEGELAFEDVKLQIRTQLGQQLAVRHYIDQLRRQTYIDIRL